MTSEIDDNSDNESFKSFDDDASTSKTVNVPKASSLPTKAVVQRYPKDEEERLLAESNTEKSAGNTLFGKGSFENAIQTYDRALSSCPSYLEYEIAVLRSNISACHLKLREWKEAVESATKGIDSLQRLEPLPEVPRNDPRAEEKNQDAAVEEVDDELEERIENLRLSGHTIHEIRALQTKLLLRRARAKSSLTSWADLQAADEDYRVLLLPAMQGSLTNSDRKTVLDGQRALVPRLNEAKEREMADMMGKLKGLGNSLLSPFGLSTDNFQFIKDEKTGGYSMNFQQNAGRS